MSIHIPLAPVAGSQDKSSQVIERAELEAFSRLVSATAADVETDEISGGSRETDPFVSNLFMVGIIGGRLNSQSARLGSECINLHFEFLAPIHCGDRIDTTIELASADTIKHLATYRVDCFNQAKEQVITGQAVMILPR